MTPPDRLTLVLGGIRSGKSAFAEAICTESGLERIYLATAEAFDEGMRVRIAEHRAARGPDWLTIDEPIALPAALFRHTGPGRIVLVECLTTWLTNLLVKERPVEPAMAALLAGLEAAKGPVVLVSNEVGFGVMPTTSLATRFADHAGHLHQRIACIAERVVLITAGLPLVLKGR